MTCMQSSMSDAMNALTETQVGSSTNRSSQNTGSTTNYDAYDSSNNGTARRKSGDGRTAETPRNSKPGNGEDNGYLDPSNNPIDNIDGSANRLTMTPQNTIVDNADIQKQEKPKFNFELKSFTPEIWLFENASKKKIMLSQPSLHWHQKLLLLL